LDTTKLWYVNDTIEQPEELEYELTIKVIFKKIEYQSNNAFPITLAITEEGNDIIMPLQNE
jgi:hypothetical protein